MNIGTCGHVIDDEWYADERSSYYALDKPTGIVTYVTTCRDCYEKALDEGLIVDGPIMDDFEVEPDLPDVIFDEHGNKIRLTPEEEAPEERTLGSFFDNV